MTVIDFQSDKKISVVIDRGIQLSKGKIASYAAHAVLTVCVGPISEEGPLSPGDAREMLAHKITILEANGQDVMKMLSERAKKLHVNEAVMVLVDEDDHDRRVVPCIAFGPDANDLIDRITGDLKQL